MITKLIKWFYAWKDKRNDFRHKEAKRLDEEHQELDDLGEEQLETIRRLNKEARDARKKTKRITLPSPKAGETK